MPGTARASAGGYCYHVLNRGNARARVFPDAGDYAALLGLLGEASVREPMRAVWYFPIAQPLPPRRLAEGRRRPEPVDALADDGSGRPAPAGAPDERARLAGLVKAFPFQEDGELRLLQSSARPISKL